MNISHASRKMVCFMSFRHSLIANGGDKTFADIAENAAGTRICVQRRLGPAHGAMSGNSVAISLRAPEQSYREAFEVKLAEARARGEEKSEAFEFIELLHGGNPNFRNAKTSKMDSDTDDERAS